MNDPSFERRRHAVNRSITLLFHARSQRLAGPTRVTLLVVALASMVAVLGVSSGILGRSDVTIGEETSLGDPAEIEFSAERIAPETTTTTAEPITATTVPDARPGDLRFDDDADVLPPSYVAASATEVIRDLPYGPDDRQQFDLYLPAEANAPVIVYLHHGGWIEGDRTDVPEMVLRFLERGYAIASVGYRLAPEHPFPAPMHDVKRAIRELKVFGGETGLIDGDALVLYGVSAGGHIAAFAAATVGEFEPTELTDAQAAYDSGIVGIVVSVGPTDLVQMYAHPHGWAQPMTGAHAGCEPCTVEQLELPSVGNHLQADMAPAYWAYGELDPLVDPELQGRRIADAWAEASGTDASWLDLVDGQHHVLDETMINQRQLEAFVDQAVGR